MALPRGIRNHNPLNLREGAEDTTVWKGEHAQDLDSSFEEFTDPVYGIRAGARVLMNYQDRHGLNTVDQIINRFAPPTENDTNSYAEHVADAIGVGVHDPINVRDHLYVMIKTMIKHENGVQPYSAGQIIKGINLAYA